jgi:hypothetical protein
LCTQESQKVYMILSTFSNPKQCRIFLEYYPLKNVNTGNGVWNFFKIHVKNTWFLSRTQCTFSPHGQKINWRQSIERVIPLICLLIFLYSGNFPYSGQVFLWKSLAFSNNFMKLLSLFLSRPTKTLFVVGLHLWYLHNG